MSDAPTADGGPGFLAFLAFFLLALALWFLMRNMNARMRRMSYRQQAAHRGKDEAQATPEQLHMALFGPDSVAHALVAEEGEGGPVVGFALWFRNFSTWTGVPGVYLEDLYVQPHARGAGHGKALLAALARSSPSSRRSPAPVRPTSPSR